MTDLNKLKIGTIAAILIIPIILLQVFDNFSIGISETMYLVILFPFAVISSHFLSEVTFLLLGLGFLQFPFYAVIIAFARSRKMLFVMLGTILAIHILAMISFFTFFQ